MLNFANSNNNKIKKNNPIEFKPDILSVLMQTKKVENMIA